MRKVEEYNTAATRSFHSDINFYLSFYMFDDKRMIQKIGVSFSSYHRLVWPKVIIFKSFQIFMIFESPENRNKCYNK